MSLPPLTVLGYPRRAVEEGRPSIILARSVSRWGSLYGGPPFVTPMVVFFSDAYFVELASRLQRDPDWVKGAAKVTAKLMMTVTDRSEAHLLDVQGGIVSARAARPDEPADFKFEGPYEQWARLGKERKDLNSLVLQGKIKFRGSLSKLMPLQSVLVRVEAVARSIPADY